MASRADPQIAVMVKILEDIVKFYHFFVQCHCNIFFFLGFSKHRGYFIFFPVDLLLLLSCFSRVWLCATPQTAAHQAPPSLGFSRQEHWSGLPFPSPSSWPSRDPKTAMPYKKAFSFLSWIQSEHWGNLIWELHCPACNILGGASGKEPAC